MTGKQRKKSKFIYGLLLVIAVVYEIAFIFASLFKGVTKPVEKVSEVIKEQNEPTTSKKSLFGFKKKEFQN